MHCSHSLSDKGHSPAAIHKNVGLTPSWTIDGQEQITQALHSPVLHLQDINTSLRAVKKKTKVDYNESSLLLFLQGRNQDMIDKCPWPQVKVERAGKPFFNERLKLWITFLPISYHRTEHTFHTLNNFVVTGKPYLCLSSKFSASFPQWPPQWALLFVTSFSRRENEVQG